MATMQVTDLQKALITAALVFQEEWKRDRKVEQEDREGMSEDEIEENDEQFPEEMDEEDLWSRFVDFIETRSLSHFQNLSLSDQDTEKMLKGILNKV